MDISHIQALVDQEGYPLMMQMYQSQPTVYQRICDVRPVTADEFYGTKGTTIVGAGRLEKRADGEAFAQGRLEEGYTWQCQINPYGKEIKLSRRMLEASDAVGRITNLVRDMAATVGRLAPIQKDELVANILQKGTLTAGDADYFDGSFPNNADPNPKFIYDGQPFFDDAHPIKVGSSTYSNHDASAALTDSTLDDAMVLMEQTSAVDDRGDLILNRMGSIIVPPSMETTARTLVESTGLVGSANNDINPFNGALEVIKFPALRDAASASAWWLKSSTVEGIRFYDSGLPAFRIYEDQATDSIVVQLQGYWGAAVVDWRGFYCGNKAAS